MALNWGKAISAGLITAGEEMKAHGALRIKEEYMAEEKASAAAAAHQSKLEFLYGQNVDELTNIRSALGTGMYDGDPQELEDRAKQLEYTNHLVPAGQSVRTFSHRRSKHALLQPCALRSGCGQRCQRERILAPCRRGCWWM